MVRPAWVDRLKGNVDHLYLSNVWPDDRQFRNRLAQVIRDHANAMWRFDPPDDFDVAWLNTIHAELYADAMAHRQLVAN